MILPNETSHRIQPALGASAHGPSNDRHERSSPGWAELPRLDRWIQRATVGAMVALALGLVGLGIALYAPPSHSGRPPLAQGLR